MAQTTSIAIDNPKEAVVQKAVFRAAEQLGISQQALGEILMVSDSTISRAKQSMDGALFGSGPAHAQRYEAAVMLIRVYRSLRGLFGEDVDLQRRWLQAENKHLGGVPINLLRTIDGKVRCVDYLDAMRGQ